MLTAVLVLNAVLLVVLIRCRAGPAARVFELGDADAPVPRKH